jgi:hypothetical protein
MGRNKIPEETKRRVMTLYYGSPPKSIGQIAKMVGIAKSTVFGILNEGDRKDPELDLGRVLAVNLGKNGLDVEQYAKLIRAASRLEELGISIETAYQKIVELLSACYRYDLSPSELVRLIFQLDSISDGIEIKNTKAARAFIEHKFVYFHSLISKAMREQERLEEKRKQFQDQARRQDLPVNQIEEYYQQLDMERSKQIESLQSDLETRSARTLSEVRINPLELEKLKDYFGVDMTKHQVKNVIADIASHPSKHFLLFCENNSYKQNPSDTGATSA